MMPQMPSRNRGEIYEPTFHPLHRVQTRPTNFIGKWYDPKTPHQLLIDQPTDRYVLTLNNRRPN
jgi:hypothetical protein